MYDCDKYLKQDIEKLFERIKNMIDDQIPIELDVRLKTKFWSKGDKVHYQEWYLGIMVEIYDELFLSAFGKYMNIKDVNVSTSETAPKTMDMDKMQSNNNGDINDYNCKYKHPKCNKYCKFLSVPVFEFSVYDIKKQMYFKNKQFLFANLKIQTALEDHDS